MGLTTPTAIFEKKGRHMARCQGKTKQGTRCKNDALDDSGYCRVHQKEFAQSTSEPAPEGGGDKWMTDQATVSTIGGATIGAVVGGPLGALVGGAVGAFMGNYKGWESIFQNKDSEDE